MQLSNHLAPSKVAMTLHARLVCKAFTITKFDGAWMGLTKPCFQATCCILTTAAEEPEKLE